MLAEAAPADTEDVVKPFEPEYDSLDTRLENEASVDDRDTIGLDEDGISLVGEVVEYNVGYETRDVGLEVARP